MGYSYEETNCNCCGSDKKSLFLESDKPQWYEKKVMRLVVCDECGLVYASPRPKLGDVYRTHLLGEEPDDFHRKLTRKNVLQIHANVISEAISVLGYKPKRLFDMGFGAGTIMMAAKAMGIEAGGNDVNQYSVDKVREMGFQDVQCGFTEKLSFPGECYDIITMLDYIEHTYTPMDDLLKACAMLKSGGVLYVKTLFLGSKNHIEQGENWNLFGSGHVHFFTPAKLKSMISSAGFRIRAVHKKALITVIAKKI